MSTPNSVSGNGQTTIPRRMPGKAAAGAWIGSALEYYDFFIYGSAAALIFPRLFFGPLGETGAVLVSLGTFGVAYVMRPLGSFLMGHIGDRHGRKIVMILTIAGMGAATFLIGLLPTYEQIGIAAPILLVLLRALQGIAVAGEQSGATSMTMEHAPHGRRAFFSSFTLGGTQFGFILATAVFLPISALPDEQFFSWGWRIPFLLSIVVMAVAWWIRRSLSETPEFEVEQSEETAHPDKDNKAPLRYLFRYYTADVVKVVFAALVSVTSTIFSVYALNYGVSTVGIPRATMLWMLIIANVFGVISIPLWAILADRIGRKPVFITGAFGSAALIWPFIHSLSKGDVTMMYVWGILLSGIVYSAYGGAGLAVFSEQFETRVRMSGMAIGTQFGFALGGFAPTIAAGLAGPDLTNWVPVAIFCCVCGLVATVTILTMRETVRLETRQLGNPKSPSVARELETAAR
ncbi:MFS transporter [Pseudarthrobacter sp. alpha12b]